MQASLASAAAFTAGAALPLGVAALSPADILWILVTATSLLSLAGLGALSAWLGGASIVRAVVRLVFLGVLAMGLTSAVGSLFGVSS